MSCHAHGSRRKPFLHIVLLDLEYSTLLLNFFISCKCEFHWRNVSVNSKDGQRRQQRCYCVALRLYVSLGWSGWDCAYILPCMWVKLWFHRFGSASRLPPPHPEISNPTAAWWYNANIPYVSLGASGSRLVMMLPLRLSDYSRKPPVWKQETIFRRLIRIYLRWRLWRKQYVERTKLSNGEKWGENVNQMINCLRVFVGYINNERERRRAGEREREREIGSSSSFSHNHMWIINSLLWFSVMSHLRCSDCKCLLYRINISGGDMIRSSSPVLDLQGSPFIPDSSLLRDVMVCLWPKSSISMLGTFTRFGQLSYAVQ